MTQSTTEAKAALSRLLDELPAEFSSPLGERSRAEFRVIKERNVRAVHEALWQLQQALGTNRDPALDEQSQTQDGAAEVMAMAEQLREHANHSEPRDWDYTRQHDIRALTRIGLGERVKDVVAYAVRYPFRRGTLDRALGLGMRRMVAAHWRYHNHLPDGVLDGGNIITHWEETGEYLQWVQPSVGALVADLMAAHPDLPQVQALAAEMKRISDRYGERVEAGKVE